MIVLLTFESKLRDDDLNKTREENNWFSSSNAIRIYNHYIKLDTDHNGMLSKEELRQWVPLNMHENEANDQLSPLASRFDSGSLTSIFIDRVFEECLTYDNEIVR